VAKPEGDTLRVSPIIPATENMLDIITRAQLTREGDLRAEATLQFHGINDNAYRGYFARLKENERRRVFEGILKRIVPGATLDGIEVTPRNMLDTRTNLHVRLTYSANGVLIEGARAAMLPPLWVGNAFGVVNSVIGQTGLETRKYPFMTKIACGVREQFTLQVGAAVGAPLTMPQYETIATSNLLWQIAMQMSNGTLRGNSDFQVRSVELSPREYVQLKSALKTMEFDRRKRAIFAPAARDRDADVDLLEHATVYDLRALTQMVVTTSVRKKILTYNGKKSNAELTLGYNPVWDSVTLEHAMTISTGGVETAIAKEAQNVMDASWVASAPRYPASKTLVANLPAVDIGCTIAYRTRRVLTGRPFWSFSDAFRGFEPIEQQTVSVIAPRDMALCITNTTADTPVCQISDDGDTRTYTWHVQQQAPLKEEDNLPPWWSFIKGVLVSGGRWEEYGNAVQAALVLATEQQPAAAAKAQELCTGTNDAAAKVRLIRDWLEKNIRLAGPALVELPLTCITPADRTLRDGYGNNPDRAVLYATMLRAVGLAPEFVLASWEPVLKGVQNPTLRCPQRGVFSDVLVRVTLDKQQMYLNDTDQYDVLGATAHDGRYGLALPAGTLFEIEALSAARDKGEAHYTLQLDVHGNATITRDQRFRGTAYGRFHQRYAELPPEERRRLYLEMVAAISQAARATKPLVTDYAKYPGVEKLAVAAPRYAVRDGAFMYVTLPEGGAGVPGVRSDMRENPLYWSGPLRQTTRYTIVLPPAFGDVQLAPPVLTWQAPMGGKIVFATTQQSNIVTVVRTIDLKPAIIDALSYPELFEVNRALGHPAMRTILATDAAGE
jgi:transglutaminase-like putative cysteine protease